ncbi:MAG: helix-turn-helix transcriptional regulator [Bifidobacteriaceae bacterium]|jgi:predicted transcriptional regulator YheO|nr:helix-turn-helix transcriptional regulator [Bifidobacteriaceae bacterium]
MNKQGPRPIPAQGRPADLSLQPPWLNDEDYQAEAVKVVAQFSPIVEPLAKALGPKTEVVLHDLSKLPGSIVAIAQSISGRRVGSPSTSLGLTTMSASEPPPHWFNYRTEMPGGVVCRSSTIFLYGAAAFPVAALCMNTDVTEALQIRSLFEAAVGPWPQADHPPENEVFYDNLVSLTDDILQRSIASVGRPVAAMTKAHKLRVVAELDQRGFFIVREAAEIAAEALAVTRYTIYNYLNEVRDDPGRPA